MRKQFLFLKILMPYSWWIAMLTFVAYVRLRLGRCEGIRHSWIWDNESLVWLRRQAYTIDRPVLEREVPSSNVIFRLRVILRCHVIASNTSMCRCVFA